ncbi:Protein kinase-like domain [Pseudocohnilembus persalinus]|uniref:Protein kinase-like domain n=1 Tax=Pseudocohnilembus persalinus TaxID=266149 RepID=A0A0V0Q829_PSEPJ|nr:Protein kinase-like domain [Pseudocohnilembus persalinus]|eukprot:KRW98381.1 Protein kinase-like domain [Pseudocohnilembus persalinus]
MKTYKDIYKHHQEQLNREKNKKYSQQNNINQGAGGPSYINNSKKSPLQSLIYKSINLNLENLMPNSNALGNSKLNSQNQTGNTSNKQSYYQQNFSSKNSVNNNPNLISNNNNNNTNNNNSGINNSNNSYLRQKQSSFHHQQSDPQSSSLISKIMKKQNIFSQQPSHHGSPKNSPKNTSKRTHYKNFSQYNASNLHSQNVSNNNQNTSSNNANQPLNNYNINQQNQNQNQNQESQVQNQSQNQSSAQSALNSNNKQFLSQKENKPISFLNYLLLKEISQRTRLEEKEQQQISYQNQFQQQQQFQNQNSDNQYIQQQQQQQNSASNNNQNASSQQNSSRGNSYQFQKMQASQQQQLQYQQLLQQQQMLQQQNQYKSKQNSFHQSQQPSQYNSNIHSRKNSISPSPQVSLREQIQNKNTQNEKNYSQHQNQVPSKEKSYSQYHSRQSSQNQINSNINQLFQKVLSQQQQQQQQLQQNSQVNNAGINNQNQNQQSSNSNSQKPSPHFKQQKQNFFHSRDNSYSPHSTTNQPPKHHKMLSQQYNQMYNSGSQSGNQDSSFINYNHNNNIFFNISKSQFNFHFVIGKGGFGKVWKVENKKNKKLYAMKEMSKSLVITKKSVNSVMNERQLLSQLKFPFLVNMFYAFQDRENLYLIMDLMPGGDLRYHIGRQRRFNEEQTRFFVACIFMGLEYLHNNNIIHRDIKPENLVLDSDGYVRTTDLGIARIWKPDNASDTSGTPGYMAPEVMCRQPHTFAVDYFALGVLAYEFMLGRRPYLGRSRKEIRDQILAKRVQIKRHEIPEGWSLEAADFINRLIERKPSNRLGINGPAEVKNHPWIKNFPWEKLLNKEIQAPFLPEKEDNFDQKQQISIEDEQNAEIMQQNAMLLKRPSVQNLFNGYNYDGINKQNTDNTTNNTQTGFVKSTNNTSTTSSRMFIQQNFE